MLVRFNVPRGIDKVDYKAGVYTLDDSLASHPYFQLLVKDKDIEIVDDRKLPKVDLPKPNPKPRVPDSNKDKDSSSKEDESIKVNKEA